ncbi:MAG: phosphatase PAP2 family protein, partial [Bacteroidales bacterium]|nr:phosphatase PAP2 family protein [Bacteroidales bacterium]
SFIFVDEETTTYKYQLSYVRWRKKRKKKVWLSLLIIALMVIATDQVSVFIKDTVQRLRPCHDMAIQSLVHTVHGCGGKFGFVSSHAANSFGVAMFFTMFFSHRWVGVMLMIWALIVSYSRIYLGVHYPGDVLGGALLGMIIGALFFLCESFLFKKLFRKNPKIPALLFTLCT